LRDGLHMRRTLLATRTCSRLAIHRAVNTNFEQNYETVENRADNTMASNRSTRITPRCERAAVEVWLGTCGVYEKCEFRRVSLPKTVQESGPRFESEEHIKGSRRQPILQPICVRPAGGGAPYRRTASPDTPDCRWLEVRAYGFVELIETARLGVHIFPVAKHYKIQTGASKPVLNALTSVNFVAGSAVYARLQEWNHPGKFSVLTSESRLRAGALK